MDRQSVYSTHVFDNNFNDSDDTPLQIQQQLEHFILNFRLDNKFIYRYRIVSRERGLGLMNNTLVGISYGNKLCLNGITAMSTSTT